MNELKGKCAIVTGASKGIGEAAARELASRGANVLLFARSADGLKVIADQINQSGGSALPMAGDVSVFSDVENAVKNCVEHFGSLDILVNNAGIIEPIGLLDESDPELWCAAADINFKGVYYGLRCAIPAMRAGSGGVIVNISSGAATNALEGWSQYCASKSAALALTRCAHKEYADMGIRTVGLSPGTVATEMQILIKQSGVNPISQLDPSDHIPPAAVARAIAWLCTAEATKYDGTDLSLRTEEGKQVAGLA